MPLSKVFNLIGFIQLNFIRIIIDIKDSHRIINTPQNPIHLLHHPQAYGLWNTLLNPIFSLMVTEKRFHTYSGDLNAYEKYGYFYSIKFRSCHLTHRLKAKRYYV